MASKFSANGQRESSSEVECRWQNGRHGGRINKKKDIDDEKGSDKEKNIDNESIKDKSSIHTEHRVDNRMKMQLLVEVGLAR